MAINPAQHLATSLYATQTPLLLPGTTLFCDFDGPLVDVSDRYYHTYQLGLAQIQAAYQAEGVTLPIQLLSKQQFWQMKQNRVPDTQIAHWSGLEGEQIERFLAGVSQIVNLPELLHQDQIQPGVYYAIQSLQAQEIRLVLVTLRQVSQVREFLQQHGLESAVSAIYGASEAEAAYQNRAAHKTDLLQAAIRDHQAQGLVMRDAWMVGDTEADIIAGQSLGISTVALTCGIRSEAYLAGLHPTAIYANLLTAVRFLLCPKLPAQSIR